MTVHSLMRICAELGIELALKGEHNDRLVVDAPKGALTESLRQALTEHKPALIAILKTSHNVSNSVATPAFPQGQDPMTESSAPISNAWNTMDSLALGEEESVFKSHSRFERIDTEVKKLLSGMAYDANIVDASDLATRQIIASQLLSAITSRNSEQHDSARRAFLNHGYFDDTTRTT